MKRFRDTKLNVVSISKEASFSLKLHRGDGMTLLAMNWKDSLPPQDFVGFGVEYKTPTGDKFLSIKNRIGFLNDKNQVDPKSFSSLRSPIQKFRWVHFPWNAEIHGLFTYRVTPVFMNEEEELSYGEPQIAQIELQRETYPDKINVTFTRGFVSSQAFVDRYGTEKETLSTLIPATADDGFTFKPTHPKAVAALSWMGFEARSAILDLLDKAILDSDAKVYVIAYDLCEPEILRRLKKLKKRLKIIIDDSAKHGESNSAESQAAKILTASAGRLNVKRHHMNNLQHNKTIVVQGSKNQTVVCGSTNFTWRGFYVQSNNALILHGKNPVKIFINAFNEYWNYDSVKEFGTTDSAGWVNLKISGIDASASFSPHSSDNAILSEIAEDVQNNTTSSLFYSLAFLYQTKGPIRDAINAVTLNKDLFVYGISDKKIGGLDLQKPDGNIAPVRPEALTRNIPEPFKSEPTGLIGGVGNRMHHKFLVIDFDKPTARVYLGSYNFSSAADVKNGENLILIRDPKIAVSYTIEALRIFDHYHFRVAQLEAKKSKTKLFLKKPPQKKDEKPWWDDNFRIAHKIKDRELFC